MNARVLIQKEENKEKILAFLEKDRIWSGYAICDLEPGLFSTCDWYSAQVNEEIISLCLYFKGFETPTQITFGNDSGIGKILEEIEIYKHIYAHFLPSHKNILTRYYSFEKLKTMKRMATNKERFKPFAGSASKLTENDLPELEALYAERPETFFLPNMLLNGVYYGIRKNDTLVSAAGTHVTFKLYKMACIGNVFTLPTYRNRGYATVCTSKVVEALLPDHKDIILNVESKNIPAIKVYEKLGFQEHCTYFEGPGTAKE